METYPITLDRRQAMAYDAGMTTTRIMNEAGEPMATVASEFEAIAWWAENGRRGDYVDGSGEELEFLAEF
jgi:hypothetical protein